MNQIGDDRLTQHGTHGGATPGRQGARKRSRLVAAAAVSALAALAGLGSLLGLKAYGSVLSTGQTLRVATMASGDDGESFLSALRQEIAAERAPMQLSLLEVPSVWASAQALKEQRTDVAMVRADDPVAAMGRTIFVLKSVQVALLVPAQAAVDSIPKLKGRKIGVVADDAGIDPMAKVVLDFYGYNEKQIVRLTLAELPGALQHRQVAAVAVVGPSGAGPIADAIEAFRKATRRPPRFLDLSQAAAIVDRHAVYDEAEISAGSFGGFPALPADKVTTISTSVLLVARTSLSNRAASELTRLLLATKTRLAATWSEARQLTAPAIEADALLPAHPGTIAYLTGAQPDLLDQSTNLFLLASMLTGFVGWVAAALNGLRNRRKGNEVRCHIRRLPLLLAQANAAGPEQLGNIENEVARLSEWLLQKFMANQISPSDFDSAEARVTQITALIRGKRRCASLDQLERFFDQWQSSSAAVAAG